MAITDKDEGVWMLDQAYNKQMAGYWAYSSNLQGLKTAGVNSIGWAGGAGTLGLNDNITRSSPTQVGANTNWSAVHTGSNSYQQMMALKNDNTLWTWGYGNLALNYSTGARSSPTQISGTNWGPFFSYGMRTAMAGKTDGSLWTWGSNQMGQLGQNEHSPAPSGISSPVQVPGTWSDGCTGDYANYAIKGGGIYGWGGHYNSNLGLNDNVNRSSPTQIGTDTNWSKVNKSANRLVAAIKTDGTLWGWGLGPRAIAGLSPSGKASSPIQITSGSWSEVSAGDNAVMYAIKTDGTLWAAGGSNDSNDEGQLGQNSRTNSTDPVQIPGTWASVHPYYRSVAAIKTNGTLWVWGQGTNGRLGLNDEQRRSSPTQIPGYYSTDGKGAGGTNTGSVGMIEAL